MYAALRDDILAVLNGEAVCVFAYGTSGSGKSASLRRTMELAFSELQHSSRREAAAGNVVEVSLRVLDVSTELHEVAPCTVLRSGLGYDLGKGLVEALRFGTAPCTSSAHRVVLMRVGRLDPAGRVISAGSLGFADLAGSERAEAQGPEASRELQQVHRSLARLAEVIAARERGAVHVPYRSCKLTHVLQEVLGDARQASRTVLLLALAPGKAAMPEGLRTLQYGARLAASRAAHAPGSGPRPAAEVLHRKSLGNLQDADQDDDDLRTAAVQLKIEAEVTRRELAKCQKRLQDLDLELDEVQREGAALRKAAEQRQELLGCLAQFHTQLLAAEVATEEATTKCGKDTCTAAKVVQGPPRQRPGGSPQPLVKAGHRSGGLEVLRYQPFQRTGVTGRHGSPPPAAGSAVANRLWGREGRASASPSGRAALGASHSSVISRPHISAALTTSSVAVPSRVASPPARPATSSRAPSAGREPTRKPLPPWRQSPGHRGASPPPREGTRLATSSSRPQRSPHSPGVTAALAAAAAATAEHESAQQVLQKQLRQAVAAAVAEAAQAAGGRSKVPKARPQSSGGSASAGQLPGAERQLRGRRLGQRVRLEGSVPANTAQPRRVLPPSTRSRGAKGSLVPSPGASTASSLSTDMPQVPSSVPVPKAKSWAPPPKLDLSRVVRDPNPGAGTLVWAGASAAQPWGEVPNTPRGRAPRVWWDVARLEMQAPASARAPPAPAIPGVCGSRRRPMSREYVVEVLSPRTAQRLGADLGDLAEDEELRRQLGSPRDGIDLELTRPSSPPLLLCPGEFLGLGADDGSISVDSVSTSSDEEDLRDRLRKDLWRRGQAPEETGVKDSPRSLTPTGVPTPLRNCLGQDMT